MAGFKNSSLNFVVKQNYYEQIMLVLKSCSDLMISRGVKIQNHEEKISAHIVENFMFKNKETSYVCSADLYLYYFSEVREHE